MLYPVLIDMPCAKTVQGLTPTLAVINNVSPNSNKINPKMRYNRVMNLGLILFGLGETLLITANVGVSPWTVLAQGLSFKTGYSIGLTTFFVSIAVLFLWIPLKQKPGIGTILNTIIVSVVIDVSLPYLPNPETIILQISQIIIAVVIVGIGSGFYLVANLGPGSRDGLMTGLQRITNKPISLIRAIIEISVVIFGWYLGGVVGIGTIVFAIGIGPLVSAGLFSVSRIIK